MACSGRPGPDDDDAFGIVILVEEGNVFVDRVVDLVAGGVVVLLLVDGDDEDDEDELEYPEPKANGPIIRAKNKRLFLRKLRF